MESKMKIIMLLLTLSFTGMIYAQCGGDERECEKSVNTADDSSDKTKIGCTGTADCPD
jgi:hypothetical protein